MWRVLDYKNVLIYISSRETHILYFFHPKSLNRSDYNQSQDSRQLDLLFGYHFFFLHLMQKEGYCII